ncbi:MAG: Recombinase [Parcubacteria group bacterium GW2011_GWF2_52_12]|uniref:Recombinase domain-containing protein n=1 Tax=Candidatus Vogelbacteria bacterium RIFOXYD1_FULL_51_18 TaxID=1802440 RepID=A0A1G2QL68_9BACT|nr:MAG: Recombinase [Parcubacteria group bacterium GW2011_GWC1_51_35]KKW26038.1 MAG: Recombinase [Parcubacteria group bacterium GW2011_GWF2_52_12]KKW27674.1 MAG: Recombinase [Parcubacteria group bacterium GW2011_GWF1_52_5]KKW34830.1 MAG: Recombinase [Parcubacteria group bacterium GW2011_GWB1_53_43]OHA60829.1 MAG: hypothetical protein A2569_02670 [Candidatus Vogelbacteria bacterium RIFOXYD1_FULL_51_18]
MDFSDRNIVAQIAFEIYSFAPLGYLNNPKTRGIDVDREKAHKVKKIFELYATGNYNLRELAEWCSAWPHTVSYFLPHSARYILAQGVHIIFTLAKSNLEHK